jgi:hypothetical protein
MMEEKNIQYPTSSIQNRFVRNNQTYGHETTAKKEFSRQSISKGV